MRTTSKQRLSLAILALLLLSLRVSSFFPSMEELQTEAKSFTSSFQQMLESFKDNEDIQRIGIASKSLLAELSTTIDKIILAEKEFNNPLFPDLISQLTSSTKNDSEEKETTK